MDFLDPQKRKQYTIRLTIGYSLMVVVLALATTIALYLAYGFGLDKQGHVIQNGLVFVSSRPSSADIYVNNKKYKDGTNARLNIPAGQYVIELRKQGYHNWKRALTVEGGSVSRYDYAVLFPKNLQTTTIKQYSSTPLMVEESLDRKWMLVATPEQNVFDLFDLGQENPVPRPLSVPIDILAAGSTTKDWELIEWAKDSRYVLLKRWYEKLGQTGAEYILFDREEPDLSKNISVTVGFSPSVIKLRDQKYDSYFLFDQSSGQLFTASLDNPTPQPILDGVVAFATDKDKVLYVTSLESAAEKVEVRIKDGDNDPIAVKRLAANGNYLLSLTDYSDDLYLTVGLESEGRLMVYKNPIQSLKKEPSSPLVPVNILKVDSPNKVSFSANKRFIIAENGNAFTVYDAETDRGYAYETSAPMDTPQTYATWMNGYRLSYVSQGSLVVFDYDGTNLRTLPSANPALVPIFDKEYHNLYLIDDQNALTATSLLTPEDR